jgi:hypothetical protein
VRDDDDTIPVVEVYRSVGLHNYQGPERLRIVRAAIDHVFTLEHVAALVAYFEDATHPPEARILAGVRTRALCELAAERRDSNRPDVDLERIQGTIVGLNSRGWRHPRVFTYLCDPGRDDAVEREERLPEGA